jgi:hypothetical protein
MSKKHEVSRGVGVRRRWEWVHKRLKSGKLKEELVLVWYTKLHDCQLCGFMSTPKKVRQRDDVRYWDTETDGEHSKVMLCTGCWNKVKPIAEAQREAREINYLMNILYKGTLKWQKLQTPGN